jgi:hypothetical protein
MHLLVVAASFTATLSQSGSLQTPDEYETLTGESAPHVTKLKLATRAQFTPTGHPPISATALLTLRR